MTWALPEDAIFCLKLFQNYWPKIHVKKPLVIDWFDVLISHIKGANPVLGDPPSNHDGWFRDLGCITIKVRSVPLGLLAPHPYSIIFSDFNFSLIRKDEFVPVGRWKWSSCLDPMFCLEDLPLPARLPKKVSFLSALNWVESKVRSDSSLSDSGHILEILITIKLDLSIEY